MGAGVSPSAVLDQTSPRGLLVDRVNTTFAFVVIPVQAPFAQIPVHIVQTPCVGWITAHFGCSIEIRSFFRVIEWAIAIKVCLVAAESVTEMGMCQRSRSARVLPFGSRRQAVPIPIRQHASFRCRVE